MTKCIGDYGHCENSAASRGLCRSCYSAARTRVASKLTTWDELESLGMSMPPVKSNTSGSGNSFNQQLELRRAEAAMMAQNDANVAEDLAKSGNLPPADGNVSYVMPRRSVAPTALEMEQKASDNLAERLGIAQDPAGIGKDPVIGSRQPPPFIETLEEYAGAVDAVRPPSPAASGRQGEQNDANVAVDLSDAITQEFIADVEAAAAAEQFSPQTAAPKLSLRDRSLAAVAAEPPELPTPERAAEIAAGEKVIEAQKTEAAKVLRETKGSMAKFTGNPVPETKTLVDMASPVPAADASPSVSSGDISISRKDIAEIMGEQAQTATRTKPGEPISDAPPHPSAPTQQFTPVNVHPLADGGATE